MATRAFGLMCLIMAGAVSVGQLKKRVVKLENDCQKEMYFFDDWARESVMVLDVAAECRGGPKCEHIVFISDFEEMLEFFESWVYEEGNQYSNSDRIKRSSLLSFVFVKTDVVTHSQQR